MSHLTNSSCSELYGQYWRWEISEWNPEPQASKKDLVIIHLAALHIWWLVHQSTQPHRVDVEGTSEGLRAPQPPVITAVKQSLCWCIIRSPSVPVAAFSTLHDLDTGTARLHGWTRLLREMLTSRLTVDIDNINWYSLPPSSPLPAVTHQMSAGGRFSCLPRLPAVPNTLPSKILVYLHVNCLPPRKRIMKKLVK